MRRPLAALQRRAPLASEQILLLPHDIRLRYALGSSAPGAIDSTRRDRDGQQALTQAVAQGLAEARVLLIERLQLTAPGSLEVLLAELGEELEGYFVPSSATIVIDSTPAGGSDGARRAVIHQYAHAVALAQGPAFPATWSEALATWSRLTLDGVNDAATAALLSRRLARLDLGLIVDDLDLAAGNSIWFSFLHEAYGLPAVRLTVEELAKGGPQAEALERGVQRGAGSDLASAFRELHLWSLLVGERSDGNYFSFADKLASPTFASTSEVLPALSVKADPAVAAWGATQVRLQPTIREGGLRIYFEGEFPGPWQADLLWIERGGPVHRLPLTLAADASGHVTVPLQGLGEALLLVRKLGGEDPYARRYTYAAEEEQGFPFELAAIAASPVGEPSEGILISWETVTEQQLLGFNVLRVREDQETGRGRALNPVWIPALGESSGPVSYHYLDKTAEPGTSYIYRVQGITADGLSSLSEGVAIRQLPATR